MTLALERGTTIGRLRVRAAARDAVALRARSEAMLRSVDLQAASLPAQAILCIRTLRDPLPGSIDLDGRDSASRAPWQHAVRASIESLARRAVRPALESVPASAEAVLFLDRAELLACAARDAVRGMLAQEWWWRHLFDVHAGLASVVREWAREPRCVPAVVAMLARRRADVVAVARSIARDDARRIVEAVLREHALPSVAYAIVRALTKPDVAVVAEKPAQPHWIRLVAEATEPSLVIEQQLFVAVPLLLQRAPAVVRAPSFEMTMVRWIAAQRALASPMTMSLTTRRTSPRSRVVEERAAETAKSFDESSDVKAPPESLKSSPTIESKPRRIAAPAIPAHAADANVVKRTNSALPRTPGVLHPVEQRQPPATNTLRREITYEARSASVLVASETGAAQFDAAPLLETKFTSDFAGALFLLNAGIALGFYSDFTSPTQRGIGLDIFLFVDRLGRALAGRRFTRDPIHRFLQRSAARAPRWTAPPVLAAYPDSPRRDRWIAAVANHLRLRLGARLARQLVALPGHITTSLLHLDAHFNLAVHPIEIRVAGLDRNPGWIPAAGRHVAFHFD